MPEQVRPVFPKSEHLSSLLLISKLFAGGSKSLAVFPLRAVYMPVENENLPTASVLKTVQTGGKAQSGETSSEGSLP